MENTTKNKQVQSITKEQQSALKYLFSIAEKAHHKGVYVNLKESAFAFGSIEILQPLIAQEGK